MAVLRLKGDKRRFDFLDADCLGRECFAPADFHHRGATMSGSRITGHKTPCCVNRAYHGCPSPLPECCEDAAKQRRKEGWSVSK